jgi:hypothetical protein
MDLLIPLENGFPMGFEAILGWRRGHI